MYIYVCVLCVYLYIYVMYMCLYVLLYICYMLYVNYTCYVSAMYHRKPNIRLLTQPMFSGLRWVFGSNKAFSDPLPSAAPTAAPAAPRCGDERKGLETQWFPNLRVYIYIHIHIYKQRDISCICMDRCMIDLCVHICCILIMCMFMF